MPKLWEGRFTKAVDEKVNDFNSSMPFDCRMYKEDITGSIAHAKMLGRCKIISEEESKIIVLELKAILSDLESGKLVFDFSAEDIHSFVEQELTARIGVVGKKLHTARSRNDQVALDLRLYVSCEIGKISALTVKLVEVICTLAEKNIDTIVSGYTHLQKAQPITFAHNLLAYAQMFLRDLERLSETKAKTIISPLGSGALATTTFKIDREFVAKELGFTGISKNSIDGVSDRDYCVELLSALSIIMMHLSRFSEEVILWSSWEFKYIDLDDAYSTGSSIMPQKKNPDIAELVRGKSGRVYGNLFSLLTMMKGLPLAYNKDMQEDKEAVFGAIDTTKKCLEVFSNMLSTIKVNKEHMRKSASNGFINATDCADYLVGKGLAFRDAYKITGQIVAMCIKKEKTLETMSIDEYVMFSTSFDVDVFDAIKLENCVANRKVLGGPSRESSLLQIEYCRQKIKEIVL